MSARRSCCGPETPGRTPPATTLRSSARRWTRLGSAPDPVERCWCALIVPEERRRPPGFLTHRRVSYSVGFTLPDHTSRIYDTIPKAAWTPACNADGQPREGADVAETRRPAGPDPMAGRYAGQPCAEAAPPGRPAALRGRRGLPAHRLRHQHKSRPARRPRGPPPATSPLPGDRIRCAKDTGLDHLPLQGFAQNRIWCLIVALARRPAGLLPAARPGLRPRPCRGAQDDPPAADEHPRRHRPPRPPHRPALQGRLLLGRLLLTALSRFQALPAL